MFSPNNTIIAIAAAAALSGCTHPAPTHNPQTLEASDRLQPDIYGDQKPDGTDINEVIRTGRYTITQTAPTSEQEDLLSQIVEVSIPGNLKPTVGEATRHALARSGFSLCPATEKTDVLFSRELPAAHYQIGPTRLRDALQVLGGPAWQVHVDQVTRSVCYSLRTGYQHPLTASSTATPLISELPASDI